MSFITLRTGRIHKETKSKKLKTFPTGYVGKFYRNLAKNVDGAVRPDFYGRIIDMRTYLLAMWKNICSLSATMLKGCKTTIIITSHVIDKT